MVYTKQEKQEIERVLAVFAKYLNQRDHCDIAWSNKLGYLLLDYHTYIDDVTPIGTAADLCREMLDYMMIELPCPQDRFLPDFFLGRNAYRLRE